ncbi:ParB-like protein [Prochlorococcus sp. MIT 1223]|uniref:ParB-like protein n=1 Tax=Prochlorococcus sp. MIT 1223 TaxID=3096217 RepID=UPI002A74B8D5|nr:ParB-like protein [Prochlorococcus sp. MIT 1223]
MSLKVQLPNYRQIPKPLSNQELFKIKVKDLKPTQICVGFSEVWARQEEFQEESHKKISAYLKKRPVPLVQNKNHELWMLDRHHRLKALVELDNNAEAFGYIVSELDTSENHEVYDYLSQQGWLYLYDSRGRGPKEAKELPSSLLRMEDDPYRSLVWKLKKEGIILSEPLIPYHEFQWSSWLRRRALPPFNSKNLHPAFSAARSLVCSRAASHLSGWNGRFY